MNKGIKDKLLGYGQDEFISYIESLNEEKQRAIEKQIAQSDLSVLDISGSGAPRGAFSPLEAMTTDETEKQKEKYLEIGKQAVQSGKVGAVMLAGGQGSRLGFDRPKGMFNIGVSRELFIFQCLINNLLDVVRECGAWVPLFIMTSEDNYEETAGFLKNHGYFGYDAESVLFFRQEQLPVVGPDGKLMISPDGMMLTAPNGNGGWYQSMVNTGIVDIVHEKGIEWLNVFSVDNVLQRIADPCFIGAVIDSGKASGAKVVAKVGPEEKVGVLCLEDGKPSIAEYYEMTEEMRTLRRSDGSLAYNYGVTLNYLFRVDALDRTRGVSLPLHRVFKQVKHMDRNGAVTEPEKPNAYKFETLALDMVRLQDSCLAYEVEREKEFAPVKNKTGEDSIDAARCLLRKNGVEL